MKTTTDTSEILDWSSLQPNLEEEDSSGFNQAIPQSQVQIILGQLQGATCTVHII